MVFTSMKQQFERLFLSSQRGRLFFGMVMSPALLIGLYLFIFLADEYQSKAIITVDESASTPQLGLLESIAVNGGGPSLDEQILQAFVVSPDLLLALDKELAVREHYSRSWDFLFGLSENAPIEEFISYYKKKVSIKRDPDSGLLELSVRAYAADFSQSLAMLILDRSEKFINSSSSAIASREMEFALNEIERSQRMLKKAKNSLLEFQNEYELINPDSEGQSLITIVYEMEADLARAQAELGQANQFLNSNAPQVVALKGRIEALQQEIKEQKQRLMGSNGSEDVQQINELNAKFQALNMDVETALSLYKGALGSYEMARVQASKQLKHLVVASKPYLPEKSTYPKRFYWWVTSVILLSALFGIVSIILASINEHKD